MNGKTEEVLSMIINEILEQRLIWKSGREAESIRAMTTQALYSIGDSCSTEAKVLFPHLAKHFITLIDDSLAITRAYAIRCILKSGPFQYEDYYHLMTGRIKNYAVNRLDEE